MKYVVLLAAFFGVTSLTRIGGIFGLIALPLGLFVLWWVNRLRQDLDALIKTQADVIASDLGEQQPPAGN